MTYDINRSIAELTNLSSAIGLRAPHFQKIIDTKPDIGWLEAHSENFFELGSISTKYLDLIRQDYPISLHGVGLSLGSSDGLDKEHLKKLKNLVKHINPVLVSDHLSWSSFNGLSVPDLLPLPMSKQAFQIVKSNIHEFQETIGQEILVENPSLYLNFDEYELSETEFLNNLAAETGCKILLDVNNIEVSSHNLNFDKYKYIKDIKPKNVGEIHLAGYQINNVDDKEIFIDAHNNPVYDNVWELYEFTLQTIGNKPTLIEWDSEIPKLDILVNEAKKADIIRNKLDNGQNEIFK